MAEKFNNRESILVRTSWVSTIGNAILSVSKVTVGIMSGSLAVVSDGIDSATDVIISIVMLITAKITGKKPNPKFAYTYLKAESIATIMLSFIVCYAGIKMLTVSASSIFTGEIRAMPGILAIYVTVISIIGKLLLAYYQFRQGRKIESSMLTANAKNMRADVLISLSVLLGLIFVFVMRLPILDSITGLIISLLIIRTSINIFLESNVELMDGVRDLKIYDKIFEAVEKVPEVNNPHRVRSRHIGNMYMISLDVEADGKLTLERGHELAEEVERRIRENIDNIYDIIIHVEPRGKKLPEEPFGVDREMLE